jgi:preprotein translocase subunit SecE
MGRLLKKKEGARFKKKKQDGDLSTENKKDIESGTDSASSSSGSAAAVKTIPRKKPIPTAKVATPKAEMNFLEKSVQFLKEVKVELKKVTWPSKKQTVGSTVVVILVVMIISMLLGIMDIGLARLVKIVLQ